MAGRGYGPPKTSTTAVGMMRSNLVGFPQQSNQFIKSCIIGKSKGRGHRLSANVSTEINGFPRFSVDVSTETVRNDIVDSRQIEAKISELKILNEFFSQVKVGNDTMISIQGREIWVPGSMLMWLGQKFGEKLMPMNTYYTIKIVDHPFSHVFEMIKCLFPCPTQSKVDSPNVHFLLPLAVEYKIDSLKRSCEEFLRNAPFCVENWHKILLLTKSHDLPDIFKLYVQKSACLKYHELLKRYNDLPLSAIALILDAKLNAMRKYAHLTNGDKNDSNIDSSYFTGSSYDENPFTGGGNANKPSSIFNNSRAYSGQTFYNSLDSTLVLATAAVGSVSTNGGTSTPTNHVYQQQCCPRCNIPPPSQNFDQSAQLFEPYCACYVVLDETLLAKFKAEN